MTWNDIQLSQSRRYKREFSLGDHDFFADSYLFCTSQDIMIAKRRIICIFGVDFSGLRDHICLLLTQNHPPPFEDQVIERPILGRKGLM